MTAFYSLIPAAGAGSRMASALPDALPKQYLEIAGKPVLRHVLDTFAAVREIACTFVAVAADDLKIDALVGMPVAGTAATTAATAAGAASSPAGRSESRDSQDGACDVDTAMADTCTQSARMRILRCGGATRQETVRNALAAMRAFVQDDDWVLVHDAARPGITVALTERLIATLRDDAVGGLLAMPVVDTLKRSDGAGRSIGTVPREHLWQAQTPQMFRYGLLCRALAQETTFTDEAGAVEALGLQPRLVPGEPRNFKLTLPADVAAAERHLSLHEDPRQ